MVCQNSIGTFFYIQNIIVFLDANNTVKLGDFGLSKALAQASFANTYVGVSDLTFLTMIYN